MNNNGWNEYQKMVLDALDRHQKSLDDVHKEVVSNKEHIAELRVKARVWGAVSGGFAGLAAVIGKALTGAP
jgi:hypothetical protein